MKSGGLSGTVCADEGDYLATVYVEGYTLERIDHAVIDRKVFYFK
jgi:hypothetical protein